MITLHILQLLQDNGLGTIALTGSETGNDLLWFEKLPVDKTGVFIVSRGSTLARGLRATQSFDIYARGINDIQGMQRIEDILNFFADECYPVCDLPQVTGYSENQYKNAVIVATSSIENIGLDEADRVIYVASAQITFKKEQQ